PSEMTSKTEMADVHLLLFHNGFYEQCSAMRELMGVVSSETHVGRDSAIILAIHGLARALELVTALKVE
ncbi:hypothetical protein HAX54_021160, partial [Datura stramonium]|nr:hypothetical protein [Datura stramonium]